MKHCAHCAPSRFDVELEKFTMLKRSLLPRFFSIRIFRLHVIFHRNMGCSVLLEGNYDELRAMCCLCESSLGKVIKRDKFDNDTMSLVDDFVQRFEPQRASWDGSLQHSGHFRETSEECTHHKP